MIMPSALSHDHEAGHSTSSFLFDCCLCSTNVFVFVLSDIELWHQRIFPFPSLAIFFFFLINDICQSHRQRSNGSRTWIPFFFFFSSMRAGTKCLRTCLYNFPRFPMSSFHTHAGYDVTTKFPPLKNHHYLCGLTFVYKMKTRIFDFSDKHFGHHQRVYN